METLSKDVKLDGNKVIVTKEVKEQLTKTELLSRLNTIKIEKTSLIEQSKAVKQRFDTLVTAEKEIEEMIKMFPEEKLESI